jgi:hypothetical protein
MDLGHHRMRFAEQGLTDQPDRGSGRRGCDRGAQTSASGSYDQDIVLVASKVGHQKSLKSVQIPIEQRRT